jgi:RNA polymerase sigma-70 factor (ECF subfamily)
MTDQETQDELRAELRTAWHRFVDVLVPLRPALHGYCRRLTGSVFDAEDLVQDTLLRAFGQWGVSTGEVRNPRAYLLRTATNVWIDSVRRRQTEARDPLADPDASAAPGATPETASEMRDAGSRLLQRLSPHERAAIVLKEAFDMTLEEIADLLATTTGAVKAALHRGRGRLRDPEEASSHRPRPSPELLDRFVALYDARDLKGLTALMLGGASAENPGNSFHIGADAAEGFPRFLRSVVHGHPEWPPAFTPESRRLVRAEFEGEPVLLGVSTYAGRQESLTSVFRFEEQDGHIARIRSYAFCPETVRVIGEALGLPVLTGLYRAPTPGAGREWPEAEAGR